MIQEKYCWMLTMFTARLQDAQESYIENEKE